MEIHDLTAEIIARKAQRPILVGVSGIDASGKGFIAAKLLKTLLEEQLRVAAINVDGWLNLPRVRFSDVDPGRHFYENALRLDAMFGRLVLPLRRAGNVSLAADLLEESATAYHKHKYALDNIDVILLEGIFIFKPRYLQFFDLKIWIDCDFKTALNRAVARSQEGLSPAETIAAYERIYFPAQRIHLEVDRPMASADIIFDNN